MAPSDLKELTEAKQLINEGKFDESLKLLDNFEQNRDHTIFETVSCHLLKCDIYFNQRLFKKVIELAEKTYNESLGLSKNILSVDILLIMAHSLIWLENPEEALQKLKQVDELVKSLKEENLNDCIKQESRIAFLKGMAYNPWFSKEGNPDLALEFFEKSLNIQESLGKKPHSYSLMQIAWLLSSYKGELNRALEYAKRSLITAKESGKKTAIAWGYHTLGVIYGMKGETDQSIKFYKKCVEISKELNDKLQLAYIIGNLGEHYIGKGEPDRALGLLNQSIELNKELNRKRDLMFSYGQIINILIEKGDIELAKENLNNMERLNIQLNDSKLNLWYLYCKARILKTSPRARNRGKAEEILTQILNEVEDDYQLTRIILLDLCDLLLIELRLTNDPEVLQEIESYIAQLLEISQKSHSYWVLGETYLLQVKLALIKFDLKKARKLLTKGQQIAESFGLDLLARKISNEHDELLKQLDNWENLKESNASIAERMELSRMNDQMNNLVQKRIVTPEEIKKEEPVVILIISKGGNPIFSQSFAKGWSFEDHLFGGFLSAINSFSDEIFSQGLDRAIFGEYTIIMKEISPFIACYLFRGQSYLAQQRIKYFTDTVKNNKEIWETFNNSYLTNRLIELSDVPSLDGLISKIFVEKSI